MRVCFVGGGNMGEAIIKSLLNKGTISPNAITVSDISQQRRDLLEKEYGVKTTINNSEAIKNTDVVILAIKPQDLNNVMIELKNDLSRQLVLSIIAGATMDTLKQGLDHAYLVRAMPNMPAQIGEGMTVWTATDEVAPDHKEFAKSILSAAGEEIYVNSEKYIDMATALSGSGPAYIFLVIEALTDAGVHIGLPRNIAEKLVIETTLGSTRTVKELKKHPAELRNMVTSPGGTTAEGILQLELGGLRSLMLKAVIAAYEKSKNLDSKKQ
jgi:pyrroline-5-carboxylate reductase